MAGVGEPGVAAARRHAGHQQSLQGGPRHRSATGGPGAGASAGQPGQRLQRLRRSGRTRRQEARGDRRRLFAVAAWRDTDLFTDAERAALALSEYATRLSDRSDPVPDEIWDAAAKHFSEPQLAAIVLWIAVSNFFNRINVTTRQPAPQNW